MSDRDDKETGLVAPCHACPGCGARERDRLVWQGDEEVECQTCGRVYRPERGDDDDPEPTIRTA